MHTMYSWLSCPAAACPRRPASGQTPSPISSCVRPPAVIIMRRKHSEIRAQVRKDLASAPGLPHPPPPRGRARTFSGVPDRGPRAYSRQPRRSKHRETGSIPPSLSGSEHLAGRWGRCRSLAGHDDTSYQTCRGEHFGGALECSVGLRDVRILGCEIACFRWPVEG